MYVSSVCVRVCRYIDPHKHTHTHTHCPVQMRNRWMKSRGVVKSGSLQEEEEEEKANIALAHILKSAFYSALSVNTLER